MAAFSKTTSILKKNNSQKLVNIGVCTISRRAIHPVAGDEFTHLLGEIIRWITRIRELHPWIRMENNNDITGGSLMRRSRCLEVKRKFSLWTHRTRWEWLYSWKTSLTDDLVIQTIWRTVDRQRNLWGEFLWNCFFPFVFGVPVVFLLFFVVCLLTWRWFAHGAVMYLLLCSFVSYFCWIFLPCITHRRPLISWVIAQSSGL